MRSHTPQPHGLMIMQPRTGLVSAMSPSRTTAWYQSGKFCSRVTESARLLIGPSPEWADARCPRGLRRFIEREQE